MIVRSYESLKTKLMKVQADIQFIKSCKKENLIPIFAKVNLAIKSDSRKLKLSLARIMESEMENKHDEKKKLKKEIVAISNQLKGVLGLILYNALVHKIELTVKSRFKSISFRHQKKLLKFREAQTAKNCYINPRPMEHVVHNFASYNLWQIEINALSYGLDYHIPTNINRNTITTESESFFQSFLRDISHMPEHEINKVNTKLRSTCEK